jgi:uncharacterized protein (DUF983 family)
MSGEGDGRHGQRHGLGKRIFTMLGLIIGLIVIGVLMWLVNAYIPMAQPFKNILNIVVIIAVVLWLLSVFGVLGSLNGPIPQLRH